LPSIFRDYVRTTWMTLYVVEMYLLLNASHNTACNEFEFFYFRILKSQTIF